MQNNDVSIKPWSDKLQKIPSPMSLSWKDNSISTLWFNKVSCRTIILFMFFFSIIVAHKNYGQWFFILKNIHLSSLVHYFTKVLFHKTRALFHKNCIIPQRFRKIYFQLSSSKEIALWTMRSFCFKDSTPAEILI